MRGKITRHLILIAGLAASYTSITIMELLDSWAYIAFSLVFFGLLGGALWTLKLLIQRRVLDPIEALGLIADDVAEGRLKKVYHLKQDDEVGLLYKKFTALVMSWQWERESLVGSKEMLSDKLAKLDHETQLRQQLERSSEDLKHEMKEATEKLMQAEKLVVLGTLVSSLAHDMASPIQVIAQARGEAEKLQENLQQRIDALLGDSDDSEVVEIRDAFRKDFGLLHDLLGEIALGNRVITNLQSAIRNQARSDSQMEEVPLRMLIQECCLIVKGKLKLWRLALDCDENLRLVCKRSQVGQVLVNLLSNASDAMRDRRRVTGEEDAQIVIRALPIDPLDPSSSIIIDIEDNGDGIGLDWKDKVFEPFFTTKPVGQGTGLGLAICRRIIEAHGGTVTPVAPTELQGCCMRIVLPNLSPQEN